MRRAPHTDARLAALLLAGMMGIGALSSAAAAQCPSEGDCRKPHATPGCVMPDCCRLVCDANPLCCELAWDQACADAAIELCVGINCPAEGACDTTHATPGCSDYACCDLVTSIDGWCTYAAWDEICARLAERLCGVAPCAIDPGSATDEAEPCYERLNDGCAVGLASGRIAPGCGEAFKGRITSGGPRDTDWFALDAPARRRHRLVLEAGFPVELQYFRGGCEGPNDVKWLVAPGLCSGVVTLNFIADAGVSSLILGSGSLDRPMGNGLDCDEIDPDNPPGPDDPPPVQIFDVRWRARLDCLALGDLNGDGAVGPQDLAALLSAWGAVPPDWSADPFATDADLDGNGVVGAPDIAILLSDW